MSIAKSFERHCEEIAQTSQRFATEMRHVGLTQSYEQAIQEWKALTAKLNDRIIGLEAKVKVMAGENKEIDARRSGLKAQRDALLNRLKEIRPDEPLATKNDDGEYHKLNEIYDAAYNEVMRASDR